MGLIDAERVCKTGVKAP